MIARFLNGPADGDVWQVRNLDREVRVPGPPPPMSLDPADAGKPLDIPIHVYRLQTLLGTPVTDQRGRYLYWWVRR